MDYHKILNVGTDRFEQTMLTRSNLIRVFTLCNSCNIFYPQTKISNTVRFYVNDSSVSTCLIQVSQLLEFD